ncbi:hypothetical protein GJAV_G00063040 [Gymnothorax javanicus]|nr:hypothetical protein GJAV_G00063040 [Gymnothorax javanicus]
MTVRADGIHPRTGMVVAFCSVFLVFGFMFTVSGIKGERLGRVPLLALGLLICLPGVAAIIVANKTHGCTRWPFWWQRLWTWTVKQQGAPVLLEDSASTTSVGEASRLIRNVEKGKLLHYMRDFPPTRAFMVAQEISDYSTPDELCIAKESVVFAAAAAASVRVAHVPRDRITCHCLGSHVTRCLTEATRESNSRFLSSCRGMMGKYFVNEVDLKSTWDQVFTAFWKRYPNPFSTHVLTEDVVFREVTADHRLLTRRLLTKTNRLPRWAEKVFPANMARSVYIVEDSIVDPKNKSMTTFTWNLNHTRLMTVEERCVYRESQDRPAWTQLRREAWIVSGVYGFSRPIQEFGLARFKSNQTKALRGLELALSNMHGDSSQRPRRDTVKEASEKAKEAALAATEKAKTLASAASPQKPRQFV